MTASSGGGQAPGEHEKTICSNRGYEFTLLYIDSHYDYSPKKEMKEDESSLHGC